MRLHELRNKKISSLSFKDKLIGSRKELINHAQHLYDTWHGTDGSGLCRNIAYDFAYILKDKFWNVDSAEVKLRGDQYGVEHYWVVVTDNKNESYKIDIPYQIYEEGNTRKGFLKKPNVVFTENDVQIEKLS